ncbi:MAG: protein-export chaperone SecB [Magnetococcus sp. DMHC-6]
MTDSSPPSGMNQTVFHVERIYLKDLSFENPHAPESLREKPDPKMDFNLDTSAVKKGPEHFEVSLHLSIKVKSGDKIMFLVDVTQAGLFLLRHFPEEHLAMTLGIECPHILFPFARQVIAHLVGEGGFQPLILDPINFASLFQQARARELEAQRTAGTA